MIIIICPECYSQDIKRYDGKMADKGHDWFTCTSCSKNFTLKKAPYIND